LILQGLIQTVYGCVSNLQFHLLPLKHFNWDNERVTLTYDNESRTKNLHDILLYSPRAIDNYEKILFILYQLLKLVRYLNSLNLNIGELRLSDIYINENFWIRLKLPVESILNLYKTTKSSVLKSSVVRSNDEQHRQTEESSSPSSDLSVLSCPKEMRHSLVNTYSSYRHLNHTDLANVTKQWCNNRMSNFDYLLILNCIAGRKLDCPYNHPIFPWISDFQSLNTNLRDLSVSKFRLNKGDAHLDLIFQASVNSASGPYHLTEYLSEITYFVYKSRVTDKETLCKHVRRTWVPNEYPNSMNRLFAWTPEECIPEFYCDTGIFESIHPDLPNLQVPDWCNGSTDEFIRTHRLLLESDLVSKKLHAWVDLVFGYKVLFG
jgi:WD repeat-containing protein 81